MNLYRVNKITKLREKLLSSLNTYPRNHREGSDEKTRAEEVDVANLAESKSSFLPYSSKRNFLNVVKRWPRRVKEILIRLNFRQNHIAKT